MGYSGDELIGLRYEINFEIPLLIYHIIYSPGWGGGGFHKKRVEQNYKIRGISTSLQLVLLLVRISAK